MPIRLIHTISTYIVGQTHHLNVAICTLLRRTCPLIESRRCAGEDVRPSQNRQIQLSVAAGRTFKFSEFTIQIIGDACDCLPEILLFADLTDQHAFSDHNIGQRV